MGLGVKKENGDVAVVFFDPAPQPVGRHIAQTGHGDDHVERFVVEFHQGFTGRGDPGQVRGAREVQAAIFLDDALRQAPFLLHDVGLVRAGHQEDLADLAGHEFMEDFEGEVEDLRALDGVFRHWIHTSMRDCGPGARVMKPTKSARVAVLSAVYNR